MDCSVLLLSIYTPLEAPVVCAAIIAWVAHRYGQLLSLSIIILPDSFQLFIVIGLSLRWNNPVQRCLWSQGIIHAGGGMVKTTWLTDCFDNRRRPAAASSRRASFSALASANSFVYFASSAATSVTLTHLHVSNCRVRQLQFSGIFVALGFVGNGVITVMIAAAHDQADDDADNQSGDNRGDSAHASISLTGRRFFEFCNQAVSAMLELTITSARQWSPDIAATVDCLTDITTIVIGKKRHAP